MDNAPQPAPATAPLSLGLKPLVAALAMAFGMTVGESAHAANFTVVNLNDTGAGSLRHAIAAANGNPGADTITFDPGVTGTITLTTGELSITDSVTLQGPGPNVLTLSGNNASPVLDIPQPPVIVDVTVSGLTISGGHGMNGGGISVQDAALTLDNVVLRDNTALDKGGGLFADGFSMTLTVRNSIITGNTAKGGGGIYVEDTLGPTLIQNTTISNNTADMFGGGILLYDPDNNVTIEGCTISGNVAGYSGGGIYLYSMDHGSFTIRNSTISGNKARNGGGIFLDKVDRPTSIVNTTISGNTTMNDGGGLNINQITLYTMDLVHVTITNNTAGGGGGGFKLNRGGGASLTNVIVAGNQAGTGALGNAGTENDLYCTGPFNINNSLIQDGSSARVLGFCLGSHDFATHKTLTNVAPLLGPLQNNGGSTLTHALLSGSPAIDAGIINSGVSTLTADQRGAGFPRILGALPDMGALEYVPTYAVIGTASPLAGGTVTCTPNPVTHGSTASCTANPAVGYSFTAFSGDCSGTTCSFTNVNSAKSVTATFTQRTYAVRVTASVGGNVVCTPNPVPHGGATTCIATADPGYTFGGFVADCVGTTCSMTNVTVSKSVYAPFYLTTYTSINGTTPGGTAVTAAFTGGNPACSYLTVANRSLSAVSSAPPSGMNFPLGLFEFNTNNQCAGNTLNFTLEYARALPAGAKYYKFGPEPGNTTPHWYVLSNAVITTTGNTSQVKFSVTDNGLGDSDPTVGVIADPGGVGVPDDPAAGVQSVPTLSQWGLLLLMGLLGLKGLKGRKRVFQ